MILNTSTSTLESATIIPYSWGFLPFFTMQDLESLRARDLQCPDAKDVAKMYEQGCSRGHVSAVRHETLDE